MDDISDMSRFGHGKFSMRRGPVDLAHVVGDACEMASPVITHRRHTLTVNVPDGVVLDGDSVRLRQVVVNLLANAAKYTPNGGRIDVGAELDDDRPHVVLRVRDNGVGIPSAFLPEIFEPFTQQRESHHRSDGGLGLGLAIVRGIVQAHGGTIEVHSDGAGQGSEFAVRLPVLA